MEVQTEINKDESQSFMNKSLEFKNTLKKDLFEKLKDVYFFDNVNDGSNYNLEKYDVICLDVDHTLAIYKNDNLSDLMYYCFIKYLNEKLGYPNLNDENIKLFNYMKSNKDSYNGLDIILDVKFGTALKINYDKTIVKVFFGNQELNNEEINKLYNDSKLTDFDYKSNFSKRFHFISNLYDYIKISIFLNYVEIMKLNFLIFNGNNESKLIFELLKKNDLKTDEFNISYLKNYVEQDLIEIDLSNLKDIHNEFTTLEKELCEKNENEKNLDNLKLEYLKLNLFTFEKLYNDILESLMFNFFHFDPKTNEQYSCNKCGYFFPAIWDNPKKYLCNKFNSLDFLKNLKKKNKHIVLITNSAYEFSDFVLKNTVGEDYLDYCDVIVYFSRKPNYFKVDEKGNPINKWYFLDLNKNNHIGKEILFNNENGNNISLCDEIFKNKRTIFGNYIELENYFKVLLKKECPKFLMVGDNMFSDTLDSNKLLNFKSCYILPQLESKCRLVVQLPNNFGIKWGKYFNFCDEIKSRYMNIETNNYDNSKEINNKYEDIHKKDRKSLNITLGICKDEKIMVIPHVDYLDFLDI